MMPLRGEKVIYDRSLDTAAEFSRVNELCLMAKKRFSLKRALEQKQNSDGLHLS